MQNMRFRRTENNVSAITKQFKRCLILREESLLLSFVELFVLVAYVFGSWLWLNDFGTAARGYYDSLGGLF